MEASRALLAMVSVAVLWSVVVTGVPRSPRTESRAALAAPTSDDDVVAGGDGSGRGGNGSCARPAAGPVSRIVARATAMEQRPRDIVRCMQSSLNWYLTHT